MTPKEKTKTQVPETLNELHGQIRDQQKKLTAHLKDGQTQLEDLSKKVAQAFPTDVRTLIALEGLIESNKATLDGCSKLWVRFLNQGHPPKNQQKQ